MTDLNDKIVTLNTWSLEILKVNSNNNFTSYADVEVRLVVSSFSLSKDGRFAAKWQTNLFRDDDIKTVLLKFRHSIFVQNAAGSAEVLADVSKGSAKKLEAGSVVAQKKNDFAPASGSKVVDLKDVFIDEKGQAAYTTWLRGGKASVAGKKSTPRKSVGKRSSGKTLSVGGGTGSVVRKAIGKILTRKRDKKVTPSRAAAKGKMTLSDYKKYLEWYVDNDTKKSGRTSRAGKSSAGRRSTRK